MSKAKTKRKGTKSKGRKARRAARRIAKMQRAPYTVVGLGDRVHRGKGKRRQLGTIIGWDLRGKSRRVTWIVEPREP